MKETCVSPHTIKHSQFRDGFQAGEDIAKVEDAGGTATNSEEERKDLRALIGLELVVDYVKEPKVDPPAEQTSQVAE